MAQAICQQTLRVVESFVGLSAQVGGTRSHVSCQASGRWAPGGGSPGLPLCCFLLATGGHVSLSLTLALLLP